MKKINILIALLLSLLLGACGSEESTKEEVPGYSIVQEDEYNNGTFEYWVIPDGIFTIDESGIELISEELIDKENKTEKNVVIFFIDDERQIGNGYNMSRLNYIDKNYEYTHKSPVAMSEEDYPTAEQLDIYFRWIEIFYDVEPGELKEEDDVTQEVADEFGISFEESNEVYLKGSRR
ncbi:hypothetical protein [Jeotgalibacillus marinus]|uniref:Lipoprotein n=1 Tax=Jeotgalibacillus marinus TaxID=86667 RepID=A0ABV3Q636_9BACL